MNFHVFKNKQECFPCFGNIKNYDDDYIRDHCDNMMKCNKDMKDKCRLGKFELSS